MARAIDANELEMFPYSEVAGTEEQIADWIEQVGLSGDDTASRARNLCWKVIEGFINVVKTQPTLTQPPITGDTSDGYHTFNELYRHRAILFSVICNERPEVAWKSKRHHDGTMYDGMFIVGIDTPEGQATYHYDIDPYWNLFRVKELELAPEWDGHTSGEAIRRIGTLTQPNEGGKDKNGPTNGPLTLEELTLMTEPTPVWWDWSQGWVLARKGMIMSWNGSYYDSEILKGNFYRCPPEEVLKDGSKTD